MRILPESSEEARQSVDDKVDHLEEEVQLYVRAL